MKALYPHRSMWFSQTISPATRNAAVVGGWVDTKNFAGANSVFKIKVSAAAAPVTFTFETVEADPVTDAPLATGIVALGNGDISAPAAASITINPADAKFVADGYAIVTIATANAKRFVRARASAAGNYDVEVIGAAKRLDRI
jgi:hypothetical protein